MYTCLYAHRYSGAWRANMHMSSVWTRYWLIIWTKIANYSVYRLKWLSISSLYIPADMIVSEPEFGGNWGFISLSERTISADFNWHCINCSRRSIGEQRFPGSTSGLICKQTIRRKRIWKNCCCLFLACLSFVYTIYKVSLRNRLNVDGLILVLGWLYYGHMAIRYTSLDH